jgi:hypothetical protein
MNLAPFLVAGINGVEFATPDLSREVAESGVSLEEFVSARELIISEPWLESIRVAPLQELGEGNYLFELAPHQFEQSTSGFEESGPPSGPASSWIEVAELVDGRRWLFPNGDWAPDRAGDALRLPIAAFAPTHDARQPGTWFLNRRLWRWSRERGPEEEEPRPEPCGYKSEGWELWCESTGCAHECQPITAPGKFGSPLLTCVCPGARSRLTPIDKDAVSRGFGQALRRPLRTSG